jgi:hypothetical protein
VRALPFRTDAPSQLSFVELFSFCLRIIVSGGGFLMVAFLLWCLLFVVCWPLALLALIAYPFVWLLLLPFRLVGIAVHGALALVWAVVMLPVRLLSAPFRLSRV